MVSDYPILYLTACVYCGIYYGYKQFDGALSLCALQRIWTVCYGFSRYVLMLSTSVYPNFILSRLFLVTSSFGFRINRVKVNCIVYYAGNRDRLNGSKCWTEPLTEYNFDWRLSPNSTQSQVAYQEPREHTFSNVAVMMQKRRKHIRSVQNT